MRHLCSPPVRLAFLVAYLVRELYLLRAIIRDRKKPMPKSGPVPWIGYACASTQDHAQQRSMLREVGCTGSSVRDGFVLRRLKEPQPPDNVAIPGLEPHRRRSPFLSSDG